MQSLLLATLALAGVCAAQEEGGRVITFGGPPPRRRPIMVPMGGGAPETVAPPEEEVIIDGDVTVDYYDTNDYDTFSNGTIELPEDANLEELDLTALQSLSDITSVDDFIRVLGLDPPEDDPQEVFLRRAGSDPVMATSASCAPENRTVHLPLPRKDGNLYFPTCVRLPRCGGCCASLQLACRPTATKLHEYKVLSVAPSSSNARRSMSGDGSRFRGSRRPSRSRSIGSRSRSRSTRSRSTRSRKKRQTTNYYYVKEVEHLACGCQCRVQEEDCRPAVHDYDKTNCQCKCRNTDEKQKCQSLAADHYWDNDSCKCLCSKVLSCSTTQFFDHASCSCRSIH